MDSKFYVSLEAARLLKEKGYDKPTDYIYVIDGQFYSIWRNKGGNIESNYYPAPTKAEAIDWLDERRFARIVINYRLYSDEWYGEVISFSNWTSDITYDYRTRLKAEDAAIIKALELL
jgi:hypothetical protein